LQIMIVGVLNWLVEHSKNLKLPAVLLGVLLIAGCSGLAPLLEVKREIAPPPKRQFLPLPPPVLPVPQNPVVVTPELTRLWNQEIEQGKRQNYVILGYEPQGWLTMGQYEERLISYIERLLQIIKIERETK